MDYERLIREAGQVPFEGWDFGIFRKLLPGAFHDIGAVVLYLRITPWQIPGFDLAGYDDVLRALHRSIGNGTPLQVNSHRYLVVAQST